MTSIGFTAASIGVMAAVYAVIVPGARGALGDHGRPLESPRSPLPGVGGGDRVGRHRWPEPEHPGLPAFGRIPGGSSSPSSRARSGSIVYDTVVEETGDSEAFERTYRTGPGRRRVSRSSAGIGRRRGSLGRPAPGDLTTTHGPPVSWAWPRCFSSASPSLRKSEKGIILREQVVTTSGRSSPAATTSRRPPRLSRFAPDARACSSSGRCGWFVALLVLLIPLRTPPIGPASPPRSGWEGCWEPSARSRAMGQAACAGSPSWPAGVVPDDEGHTLIIVGVQVL